MHLEPREREQGASVREVAKICLRALRSRKENLSYATCRGGYEVLNCCGGYGSMCMGDIIGFNCF